LLGGWLTADQMSKFSLSVGLIVIQLVPQHANHTTNLANKQRSQLGSRGGRNHIFRLRLHSCSKVF